MVKQGSETERLGEVELLVLLAVLRLTDGAYAVPIRSLIAKEAGVHLARGTVYVTLDRLERKLLVESRLSEPVPEPGGKAKRLFRILPAGLRALRSARRGIERLAEGTVLEGGA